MTKTETFNPLTFLAALGAGGIAVAPFVYFQYIMPHGPGLITFGELMGNATGMSVGLFYAMQAVMIIFAGIHFVLTGVLLNNLFRWAKTNNYRDFINDPLKNAGILAPFISIAMTLNVVIAVIRFFVPAIHENFQNMMLPALIFWAVIWVWLMSTEIKLLKISFTNDFDVNKVSFGWLLHPFALGMMSVAGMGIAAMAKDATIATTAGFMSITSLSMGLFLFLVKVISIFKSHFTQSGIPERQFLPSFLIVVPIMTLFSISFFRFGHFLEHQFGYELDAYYTMSIAIPFAFETWYFAFGLSMLAGYFKKDFFRKEYYVTLWAFICPFVGYSVLGSFVHKLFMPTVFTQVLVFAAMASAVVFYAFVASRYFKYGIERKKVALATR